MIHLLRGFLHRIKLDLLEEVWYCYTDKAFSDPSMFEREFQWATQLNLMRGILQYVRLMKASSCCWERVEAMSKFFCGVLDMSGFDGLTLRHSKEPPIFLLLNHTQRNAFWQLRMPRPLRDRCFIRRNSGTGCVFIPKPTLNLVLLVPKLWKKLWIPNVEAKDQPRFQLNYQCRKYEITVFNNWKLVCIVKDEEKHDDKEIEAVYEEIFSASVGTCGSGRHWKGENYAYQCKQQHKRNKAA